MGFLSEIVAEIRRDILRPDYVPDAPISDGAPRPSLRGAIEGAGPEGALLVEYKRVSPGATVPRLPSRTVEAFLAATQGANVTAYSCVATGPRFEGSPRDVATVARATPRPVLFKDFVVDPVQLDAAQLAGASAVLLIARLESEGLLERPLAELAKMAHTRGLEVLLELHARGEVKGAGDIGADAYGVNVRDLDTLQMTPEVTAKTLRAAAELRPLLGLSGVASPDDARRLWSQGVDGILVGSAVARASDPAAFLRSLRRPRRGAR